MLRRVLFFLLTLAAGSSLPASPAAQEAFAAVQARERILWEETAGLRDAEIESLLSRRAGRLAAEYDRLLAVHPEFGPGWTAYGLFLQRCQRFEEAAAAFRRANQVDPTDAVANYQLGVYYAAVDRPALAVPFLLRAIERRPEEAQFHLDLGQVLHTHRDRLLADRFLTREALDRQMLTAFRQAAALRPEAVDLALRHAEAFGDLAVPQLEDAYAAWEEVRRRAGPDGIHAQAARLHQARIRALQGRLGEAEPLLAGVTEPAFAANVAEVRRLLAAGSP